MKNIFLFRHGETDWNAQGRFQGQIDIPLNEKGKIQARALVPIFKEHSIEAILSSDLVRAWETAQIVANELKIPVFKDQRLREAHLGLAQGMTPEELKVKFDPTLIERWRSTRPLDADISYPGGETGSEIFKRALDSIIDFFQMHSLTRIGVACHGGVIRRLMHGILPSDTPAIAIPNGVIYRLGYHSQQKVLFLEP